MKEYLNRSLQDILEELVLFCRLRSSEEVYLKLSLPANVIGEFSKQFEPIEKIILEKTEGGTKAIKMLHLDGGKVELVANL